MQYCARVDNFKICNFQGDAQKIKRCSVQPSDPFWIPKQSITSELSLEYLTKLNEHVAQKWHEYNSTEWQFYNLEKDPFELYNLGKNYILSAFAT